MVSSRHRFTGDRTRLQPKATEDIPDDDLPALARAAREQLSETARIADERVDLALKVSNRRFFLTVIAIAVVFAAVIALCLYTLQTSLQAAQDAASVSTTGELASARQANIANARADLEAANGALINAGLTPVPDPGVGASSQDLTAAVGEARGALRAIGELQSKGLAISGVNVPAPSSGAFPGITPDNRPGPS